MSELDTVTKQALRLAAVGALLHNLGKIHAKFLDKQINCAPNDYLFQHILGLIAPHVGRLPANWQADFDADKLSVSSVLDVQTVAALSHILRLPHPLDDRADYSLGDLIEYLGVAEEWYDNQTGKYGIEYIFPGGSRLTHLMNRAHRGASGGEKEGIATAQQPDAADLYLSTPFGYEVAAPNVHNINNLLQQIEAVIQKHLTAPANPLPLAEVIADLRPLLSQAIADTQRPLNDVTVGDIGYTGMAFLLTQAAEWILSGRTIDHAELARQDADNTLLWRVLTIQFDTLRYLEEAASLADLRVRQQGLQETFRKVGEKLAATLLAVEIYADEQRRLFVFPNADRAHSVYQTAVQEIKDDLNLDGLRLTVALSEPVTNHPKDKGGVYIGDEVLKQLLAELPYAYAPEMIFAFWQKQAEDRQTQICTACNLRPQGYGAEQIAAYKYNPAYHRDKAEGRNICCVCMDRRSGVAQEWAENKLNSTVWLDEVADTNGRLALIVGEWDLVNFATGHLFPVNVTQTFLTTEQIHGSLQEGDVASIRGHDFRWYSYHNALVGPREAEIPDSYQRRDLFVRPLNQPVKFDRIACLPDGNYKIFVPTPIFSPSGTYQIDKGIFAAVSDSILITQDEHAQNLVRKRFWSSVSDTLFIVQSGKRDEAIGDSVPNYSFARLRRIWETTRRFWQDVLPTDRPEEIEQSLIGQKIGTVGCRLQITGQLKPCKTDDTPGLYHAYDLRLSNNVKLSVVWDPERKLFISCDNLDYLAKSEVLGAPVKEFLKGELSLEEPTGYGGKNTIWGKIIVENENVKEMPDSSYTPAIPILAEPRTFMALVPADKALDVIDAIRAKYAREMGKVRNRLPLHLGVVYFQRRTPLRAALDAGRRMLKYKLGSLQQDVWTVQEVTCGGSEVAPQALTQDTRQFDQTIAVKLAHNERSLTWHVPAVMGDGVTPDNWYPYVFIQNDVNGRPLTFKGVRPTGDGQSEECWLIHASQLKAGDQVYFTPATFDYEWLDSGGQRFAIAYDEQGRRRGSHTRPYLLDDLETIQRVWKTLSAETGLSSSQIYALRDLVETKRETWQGDETFAQLCTDAVRNAQWKDRGDSDLPLITAAAISGLLTEVIQLYMGIMKCKPQREDETNA